MATTPAIMETAGVSPKVYGRDISILAQNRSYLLNWAKRYVFEPGQAFYIPKVTKRAAASATTQPAGALTFDDMAGTKTEMTNQWAYNGAEIQISALEAMSPDMINATLMAVKESAGEALASDIDIKVLATSGEWTSSFDSATLAAFAITHLRTAISDLRKNNAPGPYFMLFHEDLWDPMDAFAELNQFQIRGDSAIVTTDAAGLIQFVYKRVQIGTSNNVSIDVAATPDDYENCIFSGEGFAIALRSHIATRQAFDITDGTEKLLIYSDYAYDVVEPTYIMLGLVAIS